MRDQHNEPLNDGLAREIAQALSVEPSPQFEARVRQRVAQESPLADAALAWWRPTVWSAAAGLAVALTVVAGWQFLPASGTGNEVARVEPQPEERSPSERQSMPGGASGGMPSPMTSVTSERVGVRPQNKPSTSTLDWLAPVMVAEDERSGMRALIADAQAGRFESVVVTEEPVALLVTSPHVAEDAAAVVAGGAATTSMPDTTDSEASNADAGRDIPQARPRQITSTVVARPIVIAPLTIKPLVQSLPDERVEGAAE
jgi:hypothetical protein